MKQKYRAVLFDLGNVVLRIHFERCFQIWAQYMQKDPRELIKTFVFDEAYCNHEVAALTGEEYHTHVCRLTGSGLTYNEFLTGWNSIFGEPVSETVQLISEIKNEYKILALTNSNVLHRQIWSVKYKDILKDFDQIFCSSQLKLRKPDPAVFEQVCVRSGIAKEEMIFVDDLEDNVKGAAAFGIKSVLFTNPRLATNEVRALLGHAPRVP
jgi:putative hydrolase of the HAD superfamily